MDGVWYVQSSRLVVELTESLFRRHAYRVRRNHRPPHVAFASARHANISALMLAPTAKAKLRQWRRARTWE